VIRAGKIMGCRWQIVLGGFMVYIGLLALMLQGIDHLVPKYEIPRYEYRLVTPSEAMHLVNDEGWRVSERIGMTEPAECLYRARSEK
jgi:hypothetical protein